MIPSWKASKKVPFSELPVSLYTRSFRNSSIEFSLLPVGDRVSVPPKRPWDRRLSDRIKMGNRFQKCEIRARKKKREALKDGRQTGATI